MTKAKTFYITNFNDDIDSIKDSISRKELVDTARTHIMDLVDECAVETLENPLTSSQALWHYLRATKEYNYPVYKCSLESAGSNFELAYSRSFVREAWKAYKDSYADAKESDEAARRYEKEDQLRQYRRLYEEFGGLSPDEVKGSK